MEFKRTAEGRVFFSSTKNASNDRGADQPTRDEHPVLKSPLTGRLLDQAPAQLLDEPAAEDPQSQYQVLALLRSLNEKLRLTQVERNTMRQELKAYRQMISSLEQKADISEKAFQALQKQVKTLPDTAEVPADILEGLEETRRLYKQLENQTKSNENVLENLIKKADGYKELSRSMSKKQADLERKQKHYETALHNGISRFQGLTERLETTETRHDSLQDQVTKALGHEEKFTTLLEQERKDRARFMRKLEKLEETVMLFNNGLEGHAQLAAPDNHNDKNLNVPGYMVTHNKIDESPTRKSASHSEAIATSLNAFWNKPLNLSTPVVIFGGLTLLIIGWFISIASVQNTPSVHTVQTAQTLAPQQNWQTTNNVEAFTPKSVDSSNLNIPSATQQKQMDRLMDQDADTVANILNAIAPGTDQGPDLNIEALNQAFAGKTPAAADTQTAPSPADDPSAKNPALPQNLKMLEALAIQGKADAQHDLAALYVVGKNGVAQDYQRAAYWFEQAANGGVANAAYNMGVLYHQGLGVPADLKQAISWYTKAAEQGHAEAAYNLGIAYIEGVGVDYDPFKATLHFEQAASKGTVEAAYNLGLIYENGLLGTPKPGEALMWYKMAADQGLPEAQTALDQLVGSLGIGRGEIDKIVEEVKKSYPALNTPAQTAKEASSAQQTIPVSPLTHADTQPSQTDQIRLVQQKLMDLDLYPGPVDGRSGPLTEDAVRAYQKAYDLPIDGKISAALLKHMGQS